MSGKKFTLWKPTIWCYARRALLSESFAWAVQNGSGVLFTVLFVVIGQMTFTLACVSVCLYAAASQVLSLDRTVGGRLFSAALFTGCMLSSGVLGGGLSSLAWLARGDASGLLEYLPSQLQKIPSKAELGLLTEWLPKLAALPLPPFIQDAFDVVKTDIEALEDAFIAQPDTAFWALLMVLYVVVSVPFAIGRASKDMRLGILMGIATLFMGSQLVFATLLPTLGLRLYWTQVTAGYVKVALVNMGGMVVTALLFFTTSAHDAVRRQMGQLLKETGVLVSHSGSVAAFAGGKGGDAAVYEPASPAGDAALKSLEDEADSTAAAPKSEADIAEALRKKARALANAPAPLAEEESLDEEAGGVALQIPHTSVLELQGTARSVEDYLSTAMLEPPLPGVVSQSGSNRSHYATVLATAKKLASVAGSIDACAMDAQLELCVPLSKKDHSAKLESAAGAVQEAITVVTASCAAACGDLSMTLQHMPLWGVCAGPKLAWRPKPSEHWETLRAALHTAANAMSPLLGSVAASEGIDVVELSFVEGRATLAVLTNCEVMLSVLERLEQDVAVALAIQPPPGAGEKKSLKERVVGSAYLSVLVLLAMGLGLPVWLIVCKSLVDLAKGIVPFFRSAAARSEILRSRSAQFAFKYWMGMCLAIIGIILLLWKGEGSGGTPFENAGSLDNFFFVWQPIYFWITAAICIQQYVEAAVFRAVLRALMTGVGGALGYAAMLNGSLANNPYFIAGMIVAFNAACGLLSPAKSMRYSLFLTAFTFNGVVACQYFGCCDVAGDPKVFGGKVLSTLFGSIYAMLVAWCFLPYYTSEKMLSEEAGALRSAIKIIQQQLKWVETAARGGEQQEGAGGDKWWESAVEEQLRGPLASVRKDLQANVIERKQLLLTWTVLPTPPVIPILLDRISRLADCLETAGNVAESALWPGKAGPAQAALLDHTGAQIDAVVEAASRVVDACCECMLATSHAAVHSTRSRVAEEVEGLWAARAALRARFISWNHAGTKDWTAADYRFLAWLHLMLMGMQEIEATAVVLAEGEAALDRDGYSAWATAWYGRRPVV